MEEILSSDGNLNAFEMLSAFSHNSVAPSYICVSKFVVCCGWKLRKKVT